MKKRVTVSNGLFFWSIWFISIMVFRFPGLLSALNPDTPINKYLITEWRARNGFICDTVLSLGQTEEGFLWIGSFDGMIRYDGRDMQLVTLRSNHPREKAQVQSILPVSPGSMWIGTNVELTWYEQGRLIVPQTWPGSPLQGKIRLLTRDYHGNIWVGHSPLGLYCFLDGKITRENCKKVFDISTPRNLYEDKKGNLWLAASLGGLYKGDRNGFQAYPLHFKKEQQKNPFISVYAIEEDHRGRIWIGTNQGVILIPGENSQEQINYTREDGLSHNTVWSMLQDSDGVLWLGTNNGINRVKEDPSGKITFQYSLENARILSILEDQEKNLWLGTYGDGLIRLQNTLFDIYYLERGVPVGSNAIFADRQGTVWLGSSMGGVYRFSNNRFEQEFQIGDTYGAGITGIQSDNNNHDNHLLIATFAAGLYKYNIKEKRLTRFTILDSQLPYLINTIYMSPGNKLWIATNQGAWCLDREQLHIYNTGNDVLTSNNILNIYEDKKHNTWIATDKGLHFFPGGQIEKKFSSIYLKNIAINGIYEDEDNTLWVGTSWAGLNRFKNGKWDAITQENGLSYDYIYQVTEEPKGFLWLTSYKGIMRIDKQNLHDFSNGRVNRIESTNFNFSDGLLSIDCAFFPRNGVLLTQDGKFWFSTHHGIASINPDDVTLDKKPPAVIIDTVRFKGHFVSPNIDNQDFIGGGQVQFTFTAPVFRSPGRVQFKYRLEGFETHWSWLDAFQNRTVVYEDLPFGEYHFQVIASNSSGVWNLKGASFNFRLSPYFYQTTFFKISTLLLSILVLITGFLASKHYLFIRKLKQKYKNSTLDPQKAETYLKKIKHYLDNEKIYRDEELSLTSFAKKLSIAPRYLSQIINEQLNKNFRDYINSYRIEEAKAFLTNQKSNDQSVLELAFEVGFNSKEAFNRAFKRYTSMTPTEYKKQRGDPEKPSGQ